MNNIPVSTTNVIDGHDIEYNVGFVSAHVVGGTNIFSDLLASFSDFFGGRSATYKSKLASIKLEAIKELMEEAQRMGGDGIVGVSVDFDEISGNNKSMFMVTVVGTAVKLIKGESPSVSMTESNFSTEISKEQFNILRMKAELFELNENGKLHFDDEQVNNIVNNGIFELSVPLLEYFKNAVEKGFPTLATKDTDNALMIFERMEPSKAQTVIYSFLGQSLSLDSILHQIASKLGLVDYEKIISVIQSSGLKFKQNALYFTTIEKSVYQKSDIEKIENLIDVASSSFLPVSEIYQVKKMLGAKSFWKCICGHENSESLQLCSDCKLDIYGFKPDSLTAQQAIAKLQKDLKVLKTSFN